MKHKYDLSIGLIVKNEERVLKRCLESLMPLKQGLKCEIIITDTGSTDGSIEIAKEYADKFIEFEWCDDFAKARNTGVDAAEGKWFMQIDADEFFDESVVEIVQFIKSASSASFDSGVFTIRNYSSKMLTTYKEAIVGRVHNFTHKKKYFEFPIHEAIRMDVSKAKDFKCTLHHDGYRAEIVNEKRDRNIKLMEAELEKNPNDYRIYALLIDGYTDIKKRLEVCETGLALEKRGIYENENYIPYLKSLHCRLNYELLEYNRVLELASQYLEEIDKNTNPMLDILYLAGSSSIQIYNHELAIKYFEDYMAMYQRLKVKPDKKYGYFGAYSFFQEELCIEAKLKVIQEHIRMDRNEKAKNLLFEFEDAFYINGDGHFIAYEAYLNAGKILKEYKQFAISYSKAMQKIKEELDDNQRENLRKEVVLIHEKFLKSMRSEEKKEVFNGFYKTRTEDGYIGLNKLRHLEFDVSKVDEEIVRKVREDELLYSSVAFADWLYYELVSEVDINHFIQKCEMSDLIDFVGNVIQNHKKGRELVSEKIINLNDIKGEKSYKWNIVLYSYLINVDEYSSINEKNKILDIFEKYVEEAFSNINELYKSEKIMQYIEVLQKKDAFVYLIYEAWRERKQKPVLFIRALKKGLYYCEELGNCVEVIAEMVQKEVAISEEKSIEFKKLGCQVKASIKAFIESNKMNEARMILQQYEKINPTDMEIAALYELTKSAE